MCMSKSHYDRQSVSQRVLVRSRRGFRGLHPNEFQSDVWRGTLRWNCWCHHWEGCMWSVQCNVEFGCQLSICSGTKENLDRVGRSQDLADANRLLASRPALNARALTLVPIYALCLPFLFLLENISYFYKYLYVYIIQIHIQILIKITYVYAYIHKCLQIQICIFDSLIIGKFVSSL
jgi:hypothetical protein